MYNFCLLYVNLKPHLQLFVPLDVEMVVLVHLQTDAFAAVDGQEQRVLKVSL